MSSEVIAVVLVKYPLAEYFVFLCCIATHGLCVNDSRYISLNLS